MAKLSLPKVVSVDTEGDGWVGGTDAGSSVAGAEGLAAGTRVIVSTMGSVVFVGCGIFAISVGDTVIVRLQADVVIINKQKSKMFVFIVLYPFEPIIVIKKKKLTRRWMSFLLDNWIVCWLSI